MILSLKKAFLVVAMLLTLLAGLFGWSMKMMTMPLTQQHHGASIQRLHVIANGGPNRVTCPPPPFEC